MDLDLSGKHAIVCGSTQGIGKAIALQLSYMGASVTLIAREEKMLVQVKGLLKSSPGQQHDFISADFSFPSELQVKVERYIEGTRRPVNILINNTGGPPGGAIIETQTEEFMQAFTSHLVCNHILAQVVIPGMKQSGYGRIVNIISTSVKQPIKGLGVSNTTRGAVASWAKTLSSELAASGITVNNILPGATNTSRLQNLISSKALQTGHSVESIRQEWLNEIPAGRFAEPNEIANAVAFLVSPAAAYITGVSIPVDGGRTSCL